MKTLPDISPEMMELFLDSSGIDVPVGATLDEIGALMSKVPVKTNEWRFGFCDLDDSVCDDDDFLAVVSWLFPLLADDGQKSRDMAIAYSDGLAFGFENAAAWLVENGLDLKNVIFVEGTALGYAASYNRPGIVKLLLEKGCDPNACEPKGNPPLFQLIANVGEPDPQYPWIYKNALATAQMLVDAGARREVGTGKKNERAVDLAHGPLKEWLHGLDEADVFNDVMQAGTKPKHPARAKRPRA
jgi:ankyrin repeat protein